MTKPNAAEAVRAAHKNINRIVREVDTRPTGLVEPAQAYQIIGHASELARDLTALLNTVHLFLQREQAAGRLDCVDGPFADDADSAVATTDLWLTRATDTIKEARESIDNAHIAAAGLAKAEPPVPRKYRRH